VNRFPSLVYDGTLTRNSHPSASGAMLILARPATALAQPRERFSSAREAVRYAGMDTTVLASDQRRAPEHL
jgi:hypothetical protein